MRSIGCFVGTLVLLVAGMARASVWDNAMGAQAAGSYLDGGRPSVLVVAAGTELDASAGAAALRKALSSSGRASTVMDGTALGNVRAMSDDEIVDAAKSQRVDEIAVTRIFADGPTLVTTFYDRHGKTRCALSVEAGNKLATRKREAGSGVTHGAIDMVGQVLHHDEEGTKRPDTPAERRYEEQHVGFRRLAYVGVYGNGYGGIGAAYLGSGWGSPYRGDTNLSAAEFYTAVGRKDYATDFTRRGRLKTGLGVSGSLLLLTGIIMAPIGGLRAMEACSTCNKGSADAVLGVGAVSIAAGIGMIIPAIAIHRSPVDALENHRLAAKHNRALREKLGLPADRVDEDVATDVQKQPTALELHIAPSISPKSGGLTLAAEF